MFNLNILRMHFPLVRFFLLIMGSLTMLAVSRLYGETGDVSLSVEPNGWQSLMTIEGFGSQGTYRFGISSATNYNQPTNPLIVLTKRSMGFDTNGNPTTHSRTSIVTSWVRLPYPNNEKKDEAIVGFEVRLRLATSDYTFNRDSNSVATVLAGFYVQDGKTNSAGSGLAVLNNSTLEYPKPVANWSRPPLDIISGNIATVAIIGYGHLAANGRPLECVQFWITDGLGGTSPTNIAAGMIDWDYGDPNPLFEYIGEVDISGLASGVLLTVHFRAFPRIGDDDAVLDTSDGRFSFPSHEAAPTMIFSDRTDTYGRTIVIVATNGNNSTGVAVDISSFDTNSPPAAFATIAGALTAIGRTNWLLHSRSDPGGGKIYLRTGTHVWTGGAAIISNQPQTYVELDQFPGDKGAIIGSASGTRNLSSRTKIRNVTISSTSTATFDDMDFLWLDGVTITNTTDSRLIENVTNVYITRSTIPELPQGFQSVSAHSNFRLFRGNRINMTGRTIFPSIIIGNHRFAGTNGAVKIDASPMENSNDLEHPTYPIIANNTFYGQKSGSGGQLITLWQPASKFKNTNGFAVVQNIIEGIRGTVSAARCMSIASSTSSTPDTNPAPFAIIWHNTTDGERCNLLENAGGADVTQWVNADRRLAAVKNNMLVQVNTKNDRHYFPSTNGTRIGQWAFGYGVNCSGNVDLDPEGMDNGGWSWEFFGLNSYPTTNSANSAIFAWPKFVNRRASNSDGRDTAGFGDYHPETNSPLIGFARDWVLPFDIEGHPRTATRNASGAYTAPLLPSRHITLTIEPDDSFKLRVHAEPDGVLTIEASTNLIDWASAGSMVITNAVGVWVDVMATNFQQRFYRVRF